MAAFGPEGHPVAGLAAEGAAGHAGAGGPGGPAFDTEGGLADVGPAFKPVDALWPLAVGAVPRIDAPNTTRAAAKMALACDFNRTVYDAVRFGLATSPAGWGLASLKAVKKLAADPPFLQVDLTWDGARCPSVEHLSGKKVSIYVRDPIAVLQWRHTQDPEGMPDPGVPLKLAVFSNGVSTGSSRAMGYHLGQLRVLNYAQPRADAAAAWLFVVPTCEGWQQDHVLRAAHRLVRHRLTTAMEADRLAGPIMTSGDLPEAAALLGTAHTFGEGCMCVLPQCQWRRTADDRLLQHAIECTAEVVRDHAEGIGLTLAERGADPLDLEGDDRDDSAEPSAGDKRVRPMPTPDDDDEDDEDDDDDEDEDNDDDDDDDDGDEGAGGDARASGGAAAAAAADEADQRNRTHNWMSGVELKKMLEACRLPTAGDKAARIQRLYDHTASRHVMEAHLQRHQVAADPEGNLLFDTMHVVYKGIVSEAVKLCRVAASGLLHRPDALSPLKLNVRHATDGCTDLVCPKWMVTMCTGSGGQGAEVAIADYGRACQIIEELNARAAARGGITSARALTSRRMVADCCQLLRVLEMVPRYDQDERDQVRQSAHEAVVATMKARQLHPAYYGKPPTLAMHLVHAHLHEMLGEELHQHPSVQSSAGPERRHEAAHRAYEQLQDRGGAWNEADQVADCLLQMQGCEVTARLPATETVLAEEAAAGQAPAAGMGGNGGAAEVAAVAGAATAAAAAPPLATILAMEDVDRVPTVLSVQVVGPTGKETVVTVGGLVALYPGWTGAGSPFLTCSGAQLLDFTNCALEVVLVDSIAVDGGPAAAWHTGDEVPADRVHLAGHLLVGELEAIGDNVAGALNTAAAFPEGRLGIACPDTPYPRPGTALTLDVALQPVRGVVIDSGGLEESAAVLEGLVRRGEVLTPPPPGRPTVGSSLVRLGDVVLVLPPLTQTLDQGWLGHDRLNDSDEEDDD